MKIKRILVTGGAGFIGSNFVTDWLSERDEPVVNLDLLTYAGNLSTLKDVDDDPRYSFVKVDICDPATLLGAMTGVDAVVHFAAESHVDRSIDGPGEFIQTNIVGTFNLLQASLAYWRSLPAGGTSSVSSVQRFADLSQRTARRPSLPSRSQRMLVPLALPKQLLQHLIRLRDCQAPYSRFG